jgi:hypothetical protein
VDEAEENRFCGNRMKMEERWREYRPGFTRMRAQPRLQLSKYLTGQSSVHAQLISLDLIPGTADNLAPRVRRIHHPFLASRVLHVRQQVTSLEPDGLLHIVAKHPPTVRGIRRIQQQDGLFGCTSSWSSLGTSETHAPADRTLDAALGLASMLAAVTGSE